MVKVISLADDAYEGLKTIKKQHESFSDVVRRVLEKEKSRSFLSLSGAWKNDRDIEAIFKKVIEDRENVAFRY